jgi:hypothetical protein
VCQGLQFCVADKTVPRGVHVAFAGDPSRMAVSWLTYGAVFLLSLISLLLWANLLTRRSHAPSAHEHVDGAVVPDARWSDHRHRAWPADILPRNVSSPPTLHTHTPHTPHHTTTDN